MLSTERTVSLPPRAFRKTAGERVSCLGKLKVQGRNIIFDRIRRLAADGDDAFFGALADYTDGALFEVQIVEIESNQFADPYAG